MTTKPKARKFRIRRSDTLSEGTTPPASTPQQPVRPPTPDAPASAEVPQDQAIDALRREGLTGRQLRMARRVAQKHGLAVTSDYDAVHQLRAKGIDPFQRANILELVTPEGKAKPAEGTAQLPQTVPAVPGGGRNLPSVDTMPAAERRALEIAKIQADLAKRRRRKTRGLMARLALFVLLPTLIVGWYFFAVATPMYATTSQFVVQTSEQSGSSQLGNMFQGTGFGNNTDSTTVQQFLTSPEAFQRLDAEHGYRAHFSGPDIDVLQRLADDASNVDGFGVYSDHVRVSFDPTEGIIRMEVIAADPETSQQFSEALIGYAEERVDQITERVRADQMQGAEASYLDAEARRSEALAALLDIQQRVQQLDPVGETSARVAQISALETERQQLLLTLQSRLDVTSPNEAQVNALRGQIAGIEALIAELRDQMTSNTGQGSLAANNTELRLAEENYTFQTLLAQQAQQQLQSARLEADRQVRFLSMGVRPVAPDEPTYPRAFENTFLAFLIFAGIYLMISLTASILREQVNS